METSQHLGVSSVIFNAIAAFFRNQGRGNHFAGETITGKVAIQFVAAGAGFIDKGQFTIIR
jgi:hypothetical protein